MPQTYNSNIQRAIFSSFLFLTFFLFLSASLIQAEDQETVARTLHSDESISIYSYRCKLSIKSQSASTIKVQCGKRLKKKFQKRPEGKPYLGVKQKATIKGKKCYLDIKAATAKKIKIACEDKPSVDPSPTPTPSSTPTPTPSPTTSPTPTPTPSYTIGGTISGLSGSVVLQNNGADNLSISSNGSFTFPTAITDAAPYNVTVLTQPETQTCIVTNGSGTVGGSNITDVSVICAANSTTLTTSLSDLALSVTGLTEYGISGNPSSGLARIITITNTGSYAATNLVVNSPTFPSGTSSSNTCGSTLAASATCTVTVTPGDTATSDGADPCTNGTAPVPGVIQISADNSNTASTSIVILGYGCIYQGGHVFAFDDTTPSTGSVGGKVMTTSDQAAAYPNGIIWSSNGLGSDTANTSLDPIPGIDNTSTTSTGSPSFANFSSFFSTTYTNLNPFISSSFSACNGATDGSCNTQNIITFYNMFLTFNDSNGTPPFTALVQPTNTTFYAAGLCLQTIGDYSDWYLPAICELGYGATACGTSMAPTLQNAQSSLVDSGSLELTNFYHSSTEADINPTSFVLLQSFASGGGSSQGAYFKNNKAAVRCVREMTL